MCCSPNPAGWIQGLCSQAYQDYELLNYCVHSPPPTLSSYMKVPRGPPRYCSSLRAGPSLSSPGAAGHDQGMHFSQGPLLTSATQHLFLQFHHFILSSESSPRLKCLKQSLFPAPRSFFLHFFKQRQHPSCVMTATCTQRIRSKAFFSNQCS